MIGRRTRSRFAASLPLAGAIWMLGCATAKPVTVTDPPEPDPAPGAGVGAPVGDAQFRTDCSDPFLTYLSVPDPDDDGRVFGQQVFFSLGASCDECHLTYSADRSSDEVRWFATCEKEKGGTATNHINWACVAPCAQTDGCDIYNKNGDIKVNQSSDWCKSIDGCSKNFCDDDNAGPIIKTAGKVYSDIKKDDDGIASCAASAEGDADDWWDCFKTVVDVVKDVGDLFTGGDRVTYDVSCQSPFAGLEAALEGSSLPELSDFGLGDWMIANLEAGELIANSFADSCSSCEWSIAISGDVSETPARLDASCKKADGSDNSVHVDMNCLYSCALTPNCFVLNQDGDLKIDASQTSEGSYWFGMNYCSSSFEM